MGKIWQRIENQLVEGAVFYLGIVLIWIFVSWALGSLEKLQQAVELKAFLESKILLAAVVFLGRYLFFPRYRLNRWRGWTIFIVFLLVLGAQAAKWTALRPEWHYYLYLVLDALIWGYLLSSFGETLAITWHHWRSHSQVAPLMFGELWQRFWRETLQTGFLLTVFLSLIYYYLSSFFLIDSLLYSYLLPIPLLGMLLGLFWITQRRIRGWIDEDLFRLDQEIAAYLNWQDLRETEEFQEKLPWIQYLFQTRMYLAAAKRPVVSLTTLLCYLLFTGFILCLPYLFGIVVEV